MKTTFLLFIFYFCCLNLCSAQDPYDCITALEVCNSEAMSLNYGSPTGLVIENIQNSCSANFEPALEISTNWLKYKFSKSGTFTFKITPDNFWTDLDFVAFSSPDGTCASLSTLRCMFSGESNGDPRDTICYGATGLALSSTDLVEDAGCAAGDDNFLAAIEVEIGEVIYLAISNFSLDGTGYTIEHGGTATINCNFSRVESILSESIKYYPNPTSSDFTIENLEDPKAEITAELLNSDGQVILLKSFKGKTRINTDHLASGIYFVRIQKGGQFYIDKLIIL